MSVGSVGAVNRTATSKPSSIEIDNAIGRVELDVDLAVLLDELGDDRTEEAFAEVDRRGDSHEAARLGLHVGDELVRDRHVGDDARAALVVRLADLGHRDLARGALDQANTEPLLELGELAADRRLGQPERLRSRP